MFLSCEGKHKDIGALSNALCSAHSDVMSGDVEIEWTQAADQKKGTGCEVRADHDAWPAELKSCRQMEDPEVLMNGPMQ